MHTIRGEMAEELLRKEVTEETAPCGTSRTITFFAEDGEIVRQDVEIVVARGPLMASESGSIGENNGTDPSNR